MPVRDTGTEQLIKDTAKLIFFSKGKFNYTTQDIANAAGVNRAALHYYFRSRDQLVATVFHESMQSLSIRLDNVMESDKLFKDKVEELIDMYMTDMLAYPYQETFMITEINTLGHQLVETINTKPTENFLTEIEKEMQKGTIDKMDPAHFLMNLFSLLSYPLIMSPIYRQFFRHRDKGFDELISERKAVILGLIFKSR